MKIKINRYIIGAVALVALAITFLLGSTQPAAAGIGDPSVWISSGNSTITNSVAAGTQNRYTNRLDCSRIYGTKYVALEATYSCTTASTSNRLGVFIGYTASGDNTKVTATGGTITFPAAQGTAATSYSTNFVVSGWPYTHTTGVTNDNGLGGTGALTNITVKATVQ